MLVVCVLRSRDGKYTGKKIFDGSSFYMRASVRKWRAGAKVKSKDKMNADYFYGQNFTHSLELSLRYC